jgi:putative transposase
VVRGTAHRRARDARKDFLHRTSTRLVRGHDVIVIEDLAVANMVKDRCLARVIADCGWGEFRRQLAYKCQRYGRQLVVIDRWYLSSQTCSACGHRLAALSLATRAWTCPSCRARHDRDINAAVNILAAGLAAARDTPGDACGAGVRHSGDLPGAAGRETGTPAREDWNPGPSQRGVVNRRKPVP